MNYRNTFLNTLSMREYYAVKHVERAAYATACRDRAELREAGTSRDHAARMARDWAEMARESLAKYYAADK